MVQKVHDVIASRCNMDGWSNDARACFAVVTPNAGSQTQSDVQACMGMLTATQQAAYMRDLHVVATSPCD